MKVNIVMYHYVREFAKSKYPNLKGLEFSKFQNQLDYLEKNFNIITAEHLIAYTKDSSVGMPDKPAMLTFDDGYIDHYQYVYPELKKRKLQGQFFAPVQAITDNIMLEVNLIHLILERSTDPVKLANRTKQILIANGLSPQHVDAEYQRLAVPSRYDGGDVVFVKRVLQRDMPDDIRVKTIHTLFTEYVGKTPHDAAADLYMNVDQISEMVADGMHFGGHGYSHCWLGYQDDETQAFEIRKSREFLGQVGASMDDWIMCYPYGNHNDKTFDMLADLNCAIGLTATPGFADLANEHKFGLSRFDTNDYPQ